MRILVITSCTGEKASSPSNQLTLDDFRKGSAHVEARERELDEFLRPAEDLYTGQQHVRLMRGVRAFRERFSTNGEGATLDLYVLSAGYGLVPGGRRLAPYEATFQGMKARELRAWADQIGVPAAVREVLAQPFDLGFVLLGDAYLEACSFDDGVELGGPTVVFCGSRAVGRLPALPMMTGVALTNEHAGRLSCGLIALKGEIAGNLLTRISLDPPLMTRIGTGETAPLGLLGNHSFQRKKRQAARSNPSVDFVAPIPETWWQKPHREKVRYFIPEWDDLVDRDFDFETDTHSGGAGDWSNEVYAHQLFKEPNYDGLLVSKVVAEAKKKKKERINRLGVHRFLRVPRSFPVMGDCGAFGYIREKVPPYETTEILDYYTRLDFDYGVSIDHLILKETESQKKERYELTQHNAEEFLVEHRKRGLAWTPIGAVQGWDPPSYAAAARNIVSMGYDYIGIGGLARTQTRAIIQIMEAIHEVIPPGVKVHLFGIARIEGLQRLHRLGVRSVDSASYLRQAWMRTNTSYLLDGTAYAAIRIPEPEGSFRVNEMLEGNADLNPDRVKRMEQDALRALREYGKYRCSLESCLNALLEYDRFVTEDRVDMRAYYQRTLEERPWEKCGCDICRAAGVEVIIFRGNNRNRRRGFHNTYVFYRSFSGTLNGEGKSTSLPKQVSLFDPADGGSE